MGCRSDLNPGRRFTGSVPGVQIGLTVPSPTLYPKTLSQYRRERRRDMKAKLITDVNDIDVLLNILVPPVTMSRRPTELDSLDPGGGGRWSHM